MYLKSIRSYLLIHTATLTGHERVVDLYDIGKRTKFDEHVYVCSIRNILNIKCRLFIGVLTSRK